MKKLSIAKLLLLLGAMSGCGDDFAPAYILTKTRILAIQAEPPNPAFGESSTLKPLLYVKGDDQVTRIRWSFCPLQGISTNGYVCLLDQAKWDALWASFAPGPAPTLDLGEGDSMTFTNPFPPELLDTLCSNRLNSSAGQSEFAFNCNIGFPIQIRMVATTTKSELTAISEIYLPIDGETAGNQNPIVGPVRIVRPMPDVTLDNDGTITVPRDVDLHLELAMEESVSEAYRVRLKNTKGEYLKDASGNYQYEDKRESINVVWYSEIGDFGEEEGHSNRSGFLPGAKDAAGNLIPFSIAREMIWHPLKNKYKNPVRILTVVRDNRGGINWQMVRVGLEPTP